MLREEWPVFGRHEQAATWLRIWTDLGRASRTIDAYARGLAEYLLLCEREQVDPVTANRPMSRLHAGADPAAEPAARERGRAVTLARLFSGQRSDEIARLRVGCVRWQHDGTAITGDSNQVLVRNAVCLLDVPITRPAPRSPSPSTPSSYPGALS